MKLLVLIHRLPCPPDRGVKLRSAAQLRWLAARHDVWCAGLIEQGGAGEDTARTLREFKSICRGFAAVPLSRAAGACRAALSMLTGATATEAYFRSLRLELQVAEWCRDIDFDAVLASSSSMAPLALQACARRRVLDFVDLDSRKWDALAETSAWPLRWVYATEGRRLALREFEWIQRSDAGVLVNDREADLLGDHPARERVHAVENGAEVDEDTGLLPEEPAIGFLGAMDYQPNIDAVCWFAEAMWPRIRAARSDVNWYIVGRSPSRAVQRLHDGKSIHVTGTVPSVEPWLRRMRVNVAPLRLARGVQTKVVTAMGAGRPCVVTPCVAEGIGAERGREIVVAETPETFADAVVGILNDSVSAQRIGDAARAFVARTFSTDSCMKKMERLLSGALRVPTPDEPAAWRSNVESTTALLETVRS